MRRIWAALAALALLISSTSAMARPALAVDELFSQSTPGNYTFVVPDGVTSLTYVVAGGNGGNGEGHTPGTPGGRGAQISGTLAVAPGDSLNITVGASGAGYGTSTYHTGAGGGYSSIATSINLPLVVAGGGGGAGSTYPWNGDGVYADGTGGNGGIAATDPNEGGDGGNGHWDFQYRTNGADGGAVTSETTALSGGAGGGGGGGAGGTYDDDPTTSANGGNCTYYYAGGGGGAFGGISGHACRYTTSTWVPVVPFGAGYGAGGEGGPTGGGGGGGYAGGGGGGNGAASGQATEAGGGGGGGASLIPSGAVAVIPAAADAYPHVTLSGVLPAAAPTNDNVVNAQALTGTSGSVTGTTAGATLQDGEGSYFVSSTNSVWYTWMGSSRKNLVATFSGGDCSTYLYAIAGAPSGPPDWYGTQVANSNSPNCTQDTAPAPLKFLATAGTTYWLRLGVGASGTPGEFTLTWTTSSPVKGSASVTLANARKDPTTCTITVKGTNLLAGQQLEVRVSDPLAEEPADLPVTFTTQSGRWSPAPVSVPRATWGSAANEVWTQPDFLLAADAVSQAPLTLVNRCTP